jgi:diketogulonate reductase-like aldo/keto reductase
VRLRFMGTRGPLVPVIGQGTWKFERDHSRAIRALRLGLDLGMSHIDTAEMYGAGVVEEIVGEAIGWRRDEVFLASKVMPANASRRRTIKACERTLTRLQTDRLDLYLLHWPSRHPLEETIAAFDNLMQAGKIKAFGLSNFDVDGLHDAIRIAGPGRIACNQVLYHLKQRGIEHAVLPFCERNGIAVVGYSPFGQGDFPEGHPELIDIAKRTGSTPRQVALAFLISRPSLFTIPKASQALHVEENAGAGTLVLSDIELGRIDVAFPLGPRPRYLPTL